MLEKSRPVPLTFQLAVTTAASPPPNAAASPQSVDLCAEVRQLVALVTQIGGEVHSSWSGTGTGMQCTAECAVDCGS